MRVAWESTRPTKIKLEIAIVAQILFGVTQDGGGVEIVGGKLIHVPPRGPETFRFDQLSPKVRESLLAHLIGQESSLLANKGARNAIQKAVKELV